MELQAKRRTEPERLVLRLRAFGQRLCAFRQGHHVVVPVQHVQRLVPHGEVVVLVDAFNRRESDFRLAALLEFRAQRGGNDLMSEAHAQQRFADADGGAYEFGFRFETGILVGVERAHGAAHNHDAGDVTEIGKIGLFLFGDVHHFIRHAQVVETIQNAPRFLPRDVLKNQHMRLRHATIFTSSA